MHQHMSRALPRLSSPRTVIDVRVSECVSRLHPVLVQWSRTRLRRPSCARRRRVYSLRRTSEAVPLSRFRVRARGEF